MKTIKTIYQTLLHAALIAMLFLYSNENYALVKINHQVAQCCNGDDLTALLDKHIRGK